MVAIQILCKFHRNQFTDWFSKDDLNSQISGLQTKDIAKYYEIMNKEDLENCFLFRNTWSYDYDRDKIFEPVDKIITLDYFRSLFFVFTMLFAYANVCFIITYYSLR